MLCYKDKTFCSSPACNNKCGRQITDREKQEAGYLGLPIAYADMCKSM